jgi:hypothetical protein
MKFLLVLILFVFTGCANYPIHIEHWHHIMYGDPRTNVPPEEAWDGPPGARHMPRPKPPGA